ncbi:MAG: AmmeMemoRadiSam system radical SAM enzyme [Caldisericales bacterium]|nr:AmmeMemoRadiSam system radical SAM enzyme [Caldisericales bacterium]
MKLCELWLEDKDNSVVCTACIRRCRIGIGRTGACMTRKNEGGKLYSLTYGHISSIALDPIEKKPLFHFFPGSHVYSIGGWGCNFGCGMCQNYEIAHIVPGLRDEDAVSPEKLVSDALAKNADGMAFTYNEPAIWPEFVRDVFKLAKKHDLYTVLVTNGSSTKESIDYYGPYCDAYRVDIKGMTDITLGRIGIRGIDPSEILEGTVWARDRWGMHVECVTNIIPTVNDSESELRAIATWIRDNLGPKVPWHVTRFYPALRFRHLMPTDLPSLEMAEKIAKQVGLSYVYIGNVHTQRGENTYCPRCQALIIEREGYKIKQDLSAMGRCTRCGELLGIVTSDTRKSYRS